MKSTVKILSFVLTVIIAVMVSVEINADVSKNDGLRSELSSDEKELLRWYIDNHMKRKRYGHLDMCDATIRNLRTIDSIPELNDNKKNMLFSIFIDMYLDREADSIKARRFYNVVRPKLLCHPEMDKKIRSKVKFIENQTKNGDCFPFYPTLYRSDGSKLSLQDILSDRYTYIEIWATTCGPCRKELPVLHELSATYSGEPDKKIRFVSISIDDEFVKWQKFVSGVESSCEQYFVEPRDGARLLSHMRVFGVPRFILVGPDKKIVDIDAPRPTEIKNGNPILRNLI